MFIWLARFLVCPGIDLESYAGYSLSLNINTTSSQSFDSTYYKRAIKANSYYFQQNFFIFSHFTVMSSFIF